MCWSFHHEAGLSGLQGKRGILRRVHNLVLQLIFVALTGAKMGKPSLAASLQSLGAAGEALEINVFQLGIICWKQISSNSPSFFITPRNWKKIRVHWYIFPFTLPAVLYLGWRKMLCLLQSGMMGLAMIDRKVILIISKQNSHFPDLPLLIEQPLLEGVTGSNQVCWSFLILWVSM